ncbi:hypothetical protein [Olleya sp. YS]|uniref:hypothetical protein n=1 Tax=Olleya sp. YS TaxID=3028318 RepID=UPI0024344FE2|nr:hypothetical protein [Olleya sp. YS]WGD34473.1 hypothetical protein Ollyesu_11880 [Olleya sp. YS]
MNKTLITLIATIGFVTTLSAQSKEEVVDKIAQETCQCIDAKGIDMTMENKTKIEMEFGLCLIESYNKNKKEADKYFEVSLLDESSVEGIAELVGMQMVSYCPNVFSVFIEEELENDNTYSVEEVSGKFVSMTTNEFNTIVIKDSDSNREIKLIWLTYFDGSDLLDNPKKLKGKKVKVEYEELELYDPKIEEYRNFKVISRLQEM